MTWRLLCRLMAVASVGAAGLVMVGGRAGALAPSAAGYWTKGGVAPPTVPAGGLFVAQDPSSAGPQLPALPVGAPAPVPSSGGPTAISAVRITGVDPTQPATLMLTVASGSVAPNPALATVAACPITTAWTPPKSGAGDISQGPQYNCGSAPSIGKVAGDNSAISWLLPAAMQSQPGEYDVALVPGPSSAPAPFTVAFNAPGATSVQAATGPVSPAPTEPPPTFAAYSPPPAPAITFAPEVTSAPVLSVGYPAPPVTSAPAAVASSPQVVFRPAVNIPRLPGISDDRGHRLMAVVALFLLGGAWWFAGSQKQRPPRRLGALAEAAAVTPVVTTEVKQGGVGRFRRVRSGDAPRLL